MAKVIDIFKKQGGKKLLYSYFRNGSLLLAINQFLVLGKNKVSLEILRLSVQNRFSKKLKKKYKKHLIEFDNQYQQENKANSNYIWICWLQGMENAPDLVKKCYMSIEKNLSSKEIVVITEKNYKDYVELPDFIIKKYNEGIITKTHFTDILRLELLIKYGGLWLDSTVLCTMDEKRIPKYYFESELFLYQNLKPGKDGHSIYISSWLIFAKTNNKILIATRYLLYKYWEKNNYLSEYFLLHFFISMVLDYYYDDWKKIIPVSNSEPHILLLRLFEKYDDSIGEYLKNEVPFHKLTYKFEEKLNTEDTYYEKFLQ